MAILTIPKRLIKENDLIIVPRKEYENLLKNRMRKIIEEAEITGTQKHALINARENLSKGKFLTIGELKRKMGFTD